jgi:exopolysaccharide biosynthesis polyprenyl glycosylphosphotransferase
LQGPTANLEPSSDYVRAEPSNTVERLVHRRIPNNILWLPAYDVRVRQELAQRRLLAAVARQVFRVLTLHVLDATVIAAAAMIAATLSSFPDLPRVMLQVVGLTLLGLNARATYRSAHHRQDRWRIVTAVGVATVALALINSLPPHPDLSVAFLVAYALVAAPALVAGRLLFGVAVRQAHKHGIGLVRAVIVGRQADVRDVVAALVDDPHGDHCVLGYVTPLHGSDSNSLGSIDEIESILDHTDPEELILSSSLESNLLRRVADACMKRGITVLAVPTWGRGVRGWAEPVKIGPLPGFRVHSTRLAMPGLVLKRAADLSLTVVAIVVGAPLMALIAVAIKIDSHGPVFYRQRRVGLGGREFMMWKFRSMDREAEATFDQIAHLNAYPDGRLFKLESDPRVTKIGRLLRRFSLDELPQLFNVLAGDMSLVGPRPPVPAEVGKYEPRHFIRLSVVPGMTGPWQVNGRNLVTDFEEVVRMEKGYVESWSLAVDVRIMVKTVGVVLSGKGAY